MTNEEMAIAIHKGQNLLLNDLFLKNRGIICECAKSFYNRNFERCMQCGVELSDMINEAYFVLPESVLAYAKSDKKYKFISFLKFPLINCFSSLVGLRTQSGRKEPLNLSRSLDAPISDTEDITLGDTVEDIKAAELYARIEESDYFNILYSEIKRLSEIEQRIIIRHYLNNETLTSIAQSENVSINAIRDKKIKALRKLQWSKTLKINYQTEHRKE